MKWQIEYLKEALNDLKKLDNSQRLQVFKAVEKVASNPLPQSKGGFGKPLGNNNYSKLSGFLKIKLKKAGIGIVYTLIIENHIMHIIIISMREDNEAYKQASDRVHEPPEPYK